jgi:hypothetical protein
MISPLLEGVDLKALADLRDGVKLKLQNRGNVPAFILPTCS